MSSKKKKTVAELDLDVLNLATRKDAEAFGSICNDFDDCYALKNFDDCYALKNFVLQGKHSGLRYKNKMLLNMEGMLYTIEDNTVKLVNTDSGSVYDPGDVFDDVDGGDAVGLLFPWKTPKTGQSLLLNGDENCNDLVNMGYNSDFPTVSFICAGRFYGPGEDSELSVKFTKLVASGDIEVVDFTMDTSKDLTAAEKKALVAWYKNKKTGKAPVGEPGFTIVGAYGADDVQGARWHRAGTVLLHDTRPSYDTSYLLGVDENQYFGVELPGNPETVSEAYTQLMPEEAIGVSGVLRQGEWFAVPVDADEVPTTTEFAALLETESNIALPVDDVDSDRHNLHAEEGGITKSGQIYARGFALVHSSGEHNDLEGVSGQWYTFYRNTAVRSFSVQGVD